jgi:hypothetical protein
MAKVVSKKNYGLNKATKYDSESNKSLFEIKTLDDETIRARELFISHKTDIAVYSDSFTGYKLFNIVTRKQIMTDMAMITAILKNHDQKIINILW